MSKRDTPPPPKKVGKLCQSRTPPPPQSRKIWTAGRCEYFPASLTSNLAPVSVHVFLFLVYTVFPKIYKPPHLEKNTVFIKESICRVQSSITIYILFSIELASTIFHLSNPQMNGMNGN